MEGRLAALSYLASALAALRAAIPLLAEKESANVLTATKYLKYQYNIIYRQVKNEAFNDKAGTSSGFTMDSAADIS